MNELATDITTDKLENKSFVITGRLSHGRVYFEDLIKQNGGKFLKKVSGKTDYLILGEIIGSTKHFDAMQHGTKIIDETKFLEMIE